MAMPEAVSFVVNASNGTVLYDKTAPQISANKAVEIGGFVQDHAWIIHQLDVIMQTELALIAQRDVESKADFCPDPADVGIDSLADFICRGQL